jgi:PAS domain S-box-containing protein
MKRKDGIYIWLEVNAKIIIDKNNESKFILVSKDISKRKLADMKLKESEEKFRIIAENANDLIDIMNQNLQEEFYNEQAYVKILGYSKNELYSMHALDFVHPDDLEELITLYKEGFKKGEGIADVRLRHKKGHYLWFEIKGKTFFDKKGEKKALFISREITERKKSEDLLRKHAKKIEIINRIIMAGNKTKNLSKLLQIIIESTIEIMNFDGGGIYLVDDKTGIAEIVCHKGLPSDFIENTNYLKIDESPYNIIFIKGQSIITENYQKFNPERSKRWGLLSLASVPLFVKDKIIGAINIVSKNRYSFSNEEKEILQTIGRETGTVIAKIEAENALREGKAFLSNIFASIQDGISILDKEFNIIRVNPAMENWYSDMKPLIGKKCYYTFFNRTKPCEDCRCFEIINSDESFCNRIYNKKTNGEIDKIFDIYSFPLLDQKTGELKGLIHYLRDVTKRYKAQGKQKESEVKYRSILENIKEGYFELDLQGNYTFFNKAMCNILGYSQDELIGLNYTRYMEENTIKKVKKVFNNVYNTEVSHTAFQYEVLRKNKEKIFIETSVYLKFDSDGNKVGYCGLLRDITAKIKSEQVILTEIKKLKELDQIKNKFVYRASHELKTPLNSIYSASSLLLKLYKDKFDERATRLLKIINYGGERLEKLIKNMLDVSRIESGKIELKKRKENITKIIKESANELIDLIQDREINLNLKIEGDYYINVDGFRITQVLINLLSNAIKYTPPKGIISINLQKTDDYIDIKVNDTGIGFTAAEKKKIFKKFGKIERYGKGMDIITEGSGLGLYISKEIVNEHNGIIWVESEGRNKGSTFIIRLPV